MFVFEAVGVGLCCVWSTDAELMVVAEALDATMDVFAEDHTDPVLTQLGVLPKMSHLLPTLTAKVCPPPYLFT